MKSINKLINFKIPINGLFYTAYFLIILSDIFDNIILFKNVLIVVDIISIGLLMIVILCKKRFKIQFIAFLIVVGISAIISDDRALLKLPFLLMSFNDIKFNDFIKKDLIFRLILVIILLLFNVIGVTDNGVLEVRNGFVRNSFGLGHPNSFAFYLTIICLDYYYIESLKKKNNIFKPLIITIGTAFFIFFFVGSRTNILMLILISVLFLFRNKIRIKDKSIFPYVFFICMSLSIVCAYLYKTDNSFFSFFDNLLSKRVYLSNYFVNKYDISLFGNKVKTGTFYALDNAYINLFVRYGIMLSLYFIVMFKKTSKKLIMHKQYILVLLLTIFSIYGISETPMYVPAKNPYILLFAFSWTSNKTKLFNERKEIYDK